MSTTQLRRFILKPAAFAASLTPFALLVIGLNSGGLGANPVEELTHRTGDWTLIFLLITLAITPVRRFTGFGGVVQFRRMAGLFAFFYAMLHFSTYVVFDRFFDFGTIVEDVTRRPYVTVGFASLLLLIPLAVTSTKGWVKRLGGKRWKRLHQLVYVAAAGGVLHYLWLVKADTRQPIVFGVVLVALLLTRLWHPSRKEKRSRADRRPRSAPTHSLPTAQRVGAAATSLPRTTVS